MLVALPVLHERRVSVSVGRDGDLVHGLERGQRLVAELGHEARGGEGGDVLTIVLVVVEVHVAEAAILPTADKQEGLQPSQIPVALAAEDGRLRTWNLRPREGAVSVALPARCPIA